MSQEHKWRQIFIIDNGGLFGLFGFSRLFGLSGLFLKRKMSAKTANAYLAGEGFTIDHPQKGTERTQNQKLLTTRLISSLLRPKFKINPSLLSAVFKYEIS